MGQRGPKPKPNHLHIINGNPSKKSLAALQDGTRIPVSVPDMPDHLDEVAQIEWARISDELRKLGLIAEIDMAALAVYCVSYSRWVKAETRLAEQGDDALIDITPSQYKQISVWLQISNRAVEQMHKFLAEFGMTPSARNRVTISPQGDLFGDNPGDDTPDDEQTKNQGAGRFFKK